MGNAESREIAADSFQHSLNDNESNQARFKNASTRYQHRQKPRGSSARKSTGGTHRSNSDGLVLGTPPHDDSKLNGRLFAGNESFPGHERSKKPSRGPKGSRSESPVAKRRRHERGFETGTAHYYTGSQAMALPISPPQRRKFGAKTPNNCALSDTPGQSSGSYGSESGPRPRVPQYDQPTNHGWAPGRSPPTCPRSMRSANTRTACNVSGSLGTSAETSDPNPGKDMTHTPFRVNDSQICTNSKAMDSDGTTSSGSALLASSSTISSSKLKSCHSCRKPQNAEESPPWVRCLDCKHRKDPFCCTFEAAREQVMQDHGSTNQQDAVCSRCTAKTPKLILVNNDEHRPPHSQERPSKRQKTEQHLVKGVVYGQKSPRQMVHSNSYNSIVTSVTEASFTATENEKPVYDDSEFLSIPNQDTHFENIGRPAYVSSQLEQSQKSYTKAPGLAETSVEGEQQNLDLKVQNPAENAVCTRITETSGGEVCQTSTRAPAPQASRNINQEDSGKHTHHLRYSASSPTNPSAEFKEVKVKGSPTQNAEAGNESSETGSVLAGLNTVSKDSVVSFPLCTSCGIKRVFNTPRNGETDVLCKTCANAKRSFDGVTQSSDSSLKDSLEDSVNLQIPETPAINRNSQQNVSPGLERESEAIERSSRSANGRDVDKSEMWPFGPKLKSVGTTHRSGGSPTLNQVEESPVTSRADGPPPSEESLNKDPDICSPDIPLTAHAPSSAPIAIPPAEVELSLQDRVECEPGWGRGLSERGEEILAKTKTISDLRLTSQKVNDLTRTIRENHQQSLISVAQVSMAQVSQDFDAVIKSMEDKHQRAIQAKEKDLQDLDAVIKRIEEKHQRAIQANEQELRQVKAELDQSKVESAKAIVSKDLSLSMAHNEITSLRSQLAIQGQDQRNNNRELTRLRTEVQALKERLASSEKSAKVVPKFIHINLFDAAPELLPEHAFFDAEAKKVEIEKRPSRKQTFRRRLTHIRRERGQYPHREIYRHSPKPCEIYRDATMCLTEEPTGTIPAKRRELQDLGPGEVIAEDMRGSKDEEKGPMSLEEMMGVPRNAIPCLVEGQLAYREGTRDAKGRLPRAKATFKVGRNVAGQLK